MIPTLAKFGRYRPYDPQTHDCTTHKYKLSPGKNACLVRYVYIFPLRSTWELLNLTHRNNPKHDKIILPDAGGIPHFVAQNMRILAKIFLRSIWELLDLTHQKR